MPVWIIPVMLITWGSLINFHQNKIWGKQLMPYSYIAPRDKAKIIKIHEVKNPLTDLTTFDETCRMIIYRPVIQQSDLPLIGINNCFLLFSSGLRAPPLS